jgi:type IV secretory pathway VirB4 component
MSIVKVGRDEYLVRCNLCGDETLQSFNSKTEARQYVENNDEGWIDDFDNGFTCPLCREYKFENTNKKYFKNNKQKTLIINENLKDNYSKEISEKNKEENELLEKYEFIKKENEELKILLEKYQVKNNKKDETDKENKKIKSIFMVFIIITIIFYLIIFITFR